MCDREMRLVGVEARSAEDRRALHTYECECGEVVALDVIQHGAGLAS